MQDFADAPNCSAIPCGHLQAWRSSCVDRLTKGLQLFLCVLVSLVFASNLRAEEKTLRILLDGQKTFPVLGVSSGGLEGTSTTTTTVECGELWNDIQGQVYRFEIELSMICDAMAEAGLATKLEFIPYPNLERAMRDLALGRADMIGESVFLSELGEGVSSSQELIRNGEFKVGIFTTPDRKDVLEITSQEELQKLTGITVQYWKVDLSTLSGMDLESVVTARKLNLIPKMISAKRADFTLSFLNLEETNHMSDLLIRIDGFRVALNDPRVFAVSAERSDVLETVNEFIKENRSKSQDQIRLAYKLGGFITDSYDHWIDVTTPRQ